MKKLNLAHEEIPEYLNEAKVDIKRISKKKHTYSKGRVRVFPVRSWRQTENCLSTLFTNVLGILLRLARPTSNSITRLIMAGCTTVLYYLAATFRRIVFGTPIPRRFF
jgi:hypothetical protein